MSPSKCWGEKSHPNSPVDCTGLVVDTVDLTKGESLPWGKAGKNTEEWKDKKDKLHMTPLVPSIEKADENPEH